MLIRQNSGTICLPWGTLEKDETPKETLYRGIQEELGIVPVIGELKLIATFDFDPTNRRLEYVYHITNGQDFWDIDQRDQATHGFEIDEISRRSISNVGDDVRPIVLRDMQDLLKSFSPWYRDILS